MIGVFKLAASDVISTGVIMKYMYIPAGSEWEFVRFGVDCDRKV